MTVERRSVGLCGSVSLRVDSGVRGGVRDDEDDLRRTQVFVPGWLHAIGVSDKALTNIGAVRAELSDVAITDHDTARQVLDVPNSVVPTS